MATGSFRVGPWVDVRARRIRFAALFAGQPAAEQACQPERSGGSPQDLARPRSDGETGGSPAI
jgi:hypothetical protein